MFLLRNKKNYLKIISALFILFNILCALSLFEMMDNFNEFINYSASQNT